MKLIFQVFFIAVMLSMPFTGGAQDSSRIRISLLTCTPGEELYSTFGHSALRVIDSNNVSDLVFNYGTFNFNDDGFYLKFVRGQLLYYLSVEQFSDFTFDYQLDNRCITEQVLDLSETEKKAVTAALGENLKKENRFYRYDFFLDNCTTRLRDLIVQHKTPMPVLPAVMPVRYRFRQAIHQYLDQNKKYWSKLGIDILLGLPCDAVMTTSQQQFLPDNLMLALDGTKNVSIVQSSKGLYEVAKQKDNSSWFTPMVCFGVLLALFILLSIPGTRAIRHISRTLDSLFFFLTGVLGVVLIFMWLGTDHSMTKQNFNLIWAWPTNILMAFFINSKRNRVKKYFIVNAAGMLLVLASWFFLPQQMNNALLPLVMLELFIAVKYYRRQTHITAH